MSAEREIERGQKTYWTHPASESVLSTGISRTHEEKGNSKLSLWSSCHRSQGNRKRKRVGEKREKRKGDAHGRRQFTVLLLGAIIVIVFKQWQLPSGCQWAFRCDAVSLCFRIVSNVATIRLDVQRVRAAVFCFVLGENSNRAICCFRWTCIYLGQISIRNRESEPRNSLECCFLTFLFSLI